MQYLSCAADRPYTGHHAPLCEIELEWIAGSEEVFHALAADLADYLSLTPEPESKLARAMKL